MGKQGFRDLLVWQLAKDSAVKIFQVSETPEQKKDYGLRDQIRRSAVSVASNIAEGDERGSDREAVRFFHIAKGSVAELRTQIQICLRSWVLERDRLSELRRGICAVGQDDRQSHPIKEPGLLPLAPHL